MAKKKAKGWPFKSAEEKYREARKKAENFTALDFGRVDSHDTEMDNYAAKHGKKAALAMRKKLEAEEARANTVRTAIRSVAEAPKKKPAKKKPPKKVISKRQTRGEDAFTSGISPVMDRARERKRREARKKK